MADARLHQPEHTSISRSWQLPAWFFCPMHERQQSQFLWPLQLTLQSTFSALGAVPQFGFVKEIILKFWGFVFCLYICCFNIHPQQRLKIFFVASSISPCMTLEGFLHLQIFPCLSRRQHADTEKANVISFALPRYGLTLFHLQL